MLYPLKKWLVEALSSVSTNNNHYRDAPDTIKVNLKEILTDLITNKDIDTFYVGNQGNFDCMVCAVLKELAQINPHIKCRIVLAYLPENNRQEFCFDTIYPEGVELVPPRFAITARNKWMVKNSDFVVTYVARSFGGAAQFKKVAEKMGKIVINLA